MQMRDERKQDELFHGEKRVEKAGPEEMREKERGREMIEKR
jgi:hypothetical protein